jgi:two-component system, chemotaxis family, chemotaxis protein CheY
VTSAAQRVLLLEDDAGIREALAECIASLGIEVALAGDGCDGLAALRSGPLPFAVLLDLRTPPLAGGDFLVEMRRDPRTADIPVIALTAGRAISRADVYRHLEKPFDLDEIAKVLLQLQPAPRAAFAT